MVALVVLEQDVVFRAVLLDEAAFEHQRLELAVRQDILEILDARDHAAHLRVVVPFRAEILAHPVFQRLGLADVDDLPALVVHQVDAGVQRKAHRLRAQFLFMAVVQPPSLLPVKRQKKHRRKAVPRRPDLFRKAGLNQSNQAVDRFLLVGAVRDDLDGRAAYDAEGQNAQKAFRIDAALLFLNPDRGLELVCFLNKKGCRARMQAHLILNQYFFDTHSNPLLSKINQKIPLSMIPF